MKFLKKYKYVLIFNLFIFISYLIIQSVPDLFGIDDTYANAYIFSPDNTIIDNINGIISRALYWDNRLGEILYFILGCFPRFIIIIVSGLRSLVFVNLVYIYTYGRNSKKFFLKKEYLIAILSCYILTLTLYPAFSDTFIWMAGSFNHLFSLHVLLIVALYFRLLIDDYDILKEHKKLTIPYLILSFLAGFTLENVTPCILIYEAFILLIMLIRNKLSIKDFILKYKISLLSIIFTSIGLLIMYFFAKTRINYFSNALWVIESKKYAFNDIVSNYKYIFILLAILLVFTLIIKKLKVKDLIPDIKMMTLLLIISILSLIVIFITPSYYVIRLTLFIYFSLLSFIVYFLNIILNNKLYIIYIILSIIFIIFLTARLVFFYKDFNEFNEYRKQYIIEQYKIGEKNITCPRYDNKYNYFFYRRLSGYEDMYCDITYIKYILDDDDINVWNGFNIPIR